MLGVGGIVPCLGRNEFEVHVTGYSGGNVPGLVLYDFISVFKSRGSGWVCISTMGPISRVQILLCPYLEIFFFLGKC